MYSEKQIKISGEYYWVDCSCTASRAGHIYRSDIVDRAIKHNPLKGGKRGEVGGLLICRASASETAAGTNVGSYGNCNLIIVIRISSCSGLKKMTRCSF